MSLEHKAYWSRQNVEHLVCVVQMWSVVAVGLAGATFWCSVEVEEAMDDAKEDVAGLLKLAAEPLVTSRLLAVAVLGADGCGSRWRERRHRWF